MALTRSSATESDLEYYRTGACHVLAVALHREFGWDIHLVLDSSEHYWEDPADPDNWIPSVVHAFAVDPDGNAWDISGARSLDEVRAETEEWVFIGEYDSDTMRSEAELSMYVGCWADDEDDEPIDRPLSEFSDQDVEEALATAKQCLACVPGFPVAAPAPA